ncbi:d7d2fc69-5b53-4a0c-9016-282b2d4a2fba [Thermothielavioides terrestris]|uniref:D7d2fc69-5b53-4a0c-9016-282b2d4a2fba n=1 Tax=Thermothielavioides terrestris TaxID=2587410 RepID=A0A446BI20_9PEZI|nr:d7d2fc69-5b53-4a0c-9016-282b2d4a2fba [Thermothielavioides terrestris]
MAGVQGVTFSTSGLPPLSANKEKGGFCWQDVGNEAGSTDFFDQYVELGDSDAESVCGGSGGLGQFCGASSLTVSPHMSFARMIIPPGGAAQGAHQTAEAAPSHLLPGTAVNNTASSSSPQVRPPQQQEQHHQQPPPPPAPPQQQQQQQQQQQHLHPLYRSASDMTHLGNTEIEGARAHYNGLSDAPGGGSISDSELLKLEGLTMRSPRIHIPQLSASEPASPPSQSTSPRKAGRLESFCNKIRTKAATLHGKAKQPPDMEAQTDESLSVPVMSTAQMEPARPSGHSRPQSFHLSESQVPSPALTSGVLNPTLRPVTAGDSGNDAAFVNGFLDDPFMRDSLLHGQFVPPLQLNGSAMPQTPLQTPLLDAWQLPMSAPNGKPLWTAVPGGTYFQAVNGDAANTWWDPSADAMDTDSVPLSFHAAANARNATLNLAIQLQHQQSFEYPAPPGTEDNNFAAGGLMIHMPQQPQGMPSAVTHGDPNHRPTRADQHHRRPKPRAPSSGARHHQFGPGVSPRKARTASGGRSTSASRLGSASPSPKIPAASVAGSSAASCTGRLHRRSASMQTLHQAAPSSVALAPDAQAAAIRKRRSWTGRRTSSSSLHHQYHTLAAAAAAAGTTSASSSSSSTAATTSSSSTCCTAKPSKPRPTSTTIPTSSSTTTTSYFPSPATAPPTTAAAAATGPAGASADGFVNYTPEDSALLMTGVAPSGSSKTKARREREAAERQREFRDRLARMVAAAGGDVSKLEKLEPLGIISAAAAAAPGPG